MRGRFGRRVQAWRGRLRALERETYALLLACRDGRTPWYAKLSAGAVVACVFSPIDLIPDFIPVLGLLDDFLIVPLGVVLVRSMVPADVMEDCRVRADAVTAGEKPVFWAAAVAIVAVWAGLGYFAYRVLWAAL